MKKLSLYLLSALAAVAGGCSDLTELNVNPTKANGSIGAAYFDTWQWFNLSNT